MNYAFRHEKLQQEIRSVLAYTFFAHSQYTGGSLISSL